MTEPNETAEPSGASGGSLANDPAIPDSCLRGSTVGQRFCEPPVAGSTPAAGLYVQWISVTERLPVRGIPVIGWFPGATQSFECALNEHDGVWCEWGTGIYLYEDERPTHWMPFPAGPTDAK